MQAVNLIVHLTAVNHDDEDLTVEDWKETVRAIIERISGEIDIELELTHTEVSF